MLAVFQAQLHFPAGLVLMAVDDLADLVLADLPQSGQSQVSQEQFDRVQTLSGLDGGETALDEDVGESQHMEVVLVPQDDDSELFALLLELLIVSPSKHQLGSTVQTGVFPEGLQDQQFGVVHLL